jgi:hypothetical protein
MGLGEVLDGAFRLLRTNARSLVLVTAAFAVPLNFLTSFLTRDLLGGLTLDEASSDPASAQTALEGSSVDQIAGTVLSLLTTAIILPLVAGAISRIVAASYLGRTESAGDALRVLRRRGVALVVGWLLVHVIEFGPAIAVAIGMVLVAVAAGASGPGLVVLLLLSFLVALVWALMATVRLVAVSPAIVEEGLGPIKGIRRSVGLTRGRFWSYLGIVVVSGLLASVLDGVLNTPSQIVGAIVGLDGVGWVIVAAGATVAQLVTTPFIAIVATLVYFDGRIRREGLDLEMMAAELEAGSPRR